MYKIVPSVECLSAVRARPNCLLFEIEHYRKQLPCTVCTKKKITSGGNLFLVSTVEETFQVSEYRKVVIKFPIFPFLH